MRSLSNGKKGGAIEIVNQSVFVFILRVTVLLMLFSKTLRHIQLRIGKDRSTNYSLSFLASHILKLSITKHLLRYIKAFLA